MKAQTDYDRRIRDDLVPWQAAASLIAREAKSVQFDAWQLNIDPIVHPLLRRMGIRQPIDIRHKFLHVFPTLLDADGNRLLSLHTMPVDPGQIDAPGAMGGKTSKIRLFAMTPDASDARSKADSHRALPPTAAAAIRHPAERAALIACFAANVAAFDYPYTVPVQPVRDRFMAALADNATLCGYPWNRQEDRLRRRLAARKLNIYSNEQLAAELARQSPYPLGAEGLNSNSGAGALRELLDYPSLPYSDKEAPFISSSMLEAQPALRAELARINSLSETEAQAAAANKPAHPTRRIGRLIFQAWKRVSTTPVLAA